MMSSISGSVASSCISYLHLAPLLFAMTNSNEVSIGRRGSKLMRYFSCNPSSTLCRSIGLTESTLCTITVLSSGMTSSCENMFCSLSVGHTSPSIGPKSSSGLMLCKVTSTVSSHLFLARHLMRDTDARAAASGTPLMGNTHSSSSLTPASAADEARDAMEASPSNAAPSSSVISSSFTFISAVCSSILLGVKEMGICRVERGATRRPFVFLRRHWKVFSISPAPGVIETDTAIGRVRGLTNVSIDEPLDPIVVFTKRGSILVGFKPFPDTRNTHFPTRAWLTATDPVSVFPIEEGMYSIANIWEPYGPITTCEGARKFLSFEHCTFKLSGSLVGFSTGA
mmetsp:Transcript_5331/g.12020  ORF Transcript_5331/g.12020 Transcript_5331/m.12020 type:complete len:340 (-) Transcript_5331:2511-3530(-)